METILTAVFEEVPTSDGGGYVCYCEELPAALSQGDTLEEARINLRDAIQLVLETNRQLREEESVPGTHVIREKISVMAV